MNQRRNKKVVKMKKKNSYFVSVFLLLFALYVLVLFIHSFTKEHLSVYEVTQKQIADDESLRGMILREETLIPAQKKGYINYYIGEGTKLSKNTTVYSTSTESNLTSVAAMVDTNDVSLSKDDTRNIRNNIANFRENFDLSDYKGILNFRYNIENALLELSDINLANNLKKVKNDLGNSSTLSLSKAKKTGIVSFCTDGFEKKKISTLSKNDFREMTDCWKQLRTNKEVSKGKPVYRVVTSEKWSVVVPVTKEQYQKISSQKDIQVTIKKDNITMTPVVRPFLSSGNYYVNFIFDKYMIHYLNNRYLDIDIQFKSAQGLKIPVSSIVKKKCYYFPSEYLTKGTGKTKKTGVAVLSYTKSGEEKIDFVPVTVYFKDDKGNVYIDTSLFEPGSTIIKDGATAGAKMQVTNVAELDGVYNCNLGYCRFQYVKIRYQNKEYAIIDGNNQYSLSNYDHIILNPKLIDENDIIY